MFKELFGKLPINYVNLDAASREHEIHSITFSTGEKLFTTTVIELSETGNAEFIFLYDVLDVERQKIIEKITVNPRFIVKIQKI